MSLKAVVAGLLALSASLGAGAAAVTVAVTDRDGKPLPSAVVAVYVQGARSVAAAGTVTEIAQRRRQFDPQLTVIQTGTAVSFPNFDTVRHHVYSFSAIQKFEIKLYAGVPSQPLVFDKPGVATLGCNIHDRMTAYVAVVGTPYFARSDAAGQAVFELPAGEHLLRAWHPALGETGAWVEQRLRVGTAAAHGAVSLPLGASWT